MPRVLLLFEFPSVNGGENSQLATLEIVRQAGYEVLALAPDQGPLADALKTEGVALVPWQVRDAGGQRQSQDHLREQLHRQFRKLKPDLVHANSLSMARLLGPVAARDGIPSVGHIRDILRLSRRTIKDLNDNTRLVAVSQATRDWHVQQGLASAKTFVLYNGVDLRRFSPREPTGYLHRELGIPLSSPLVGCIGQLGMRKGLDVWLEAARQTATQRSDVHFLIVGERHSEKDEAVRFEHDLRQFAQESPLNGRVHFLGRRTDANLLLNELQLLVHAARQEPLGRVLLEAGASGSAIVATDVGGTAEIFPADLTAAYLVAPGDATVIRQTVLELLAEPRLRQELGREARRRIGQQFDVKQAGQQLVRHYDAALCTNGR